MKISLRDFKELLISKPSDFTVTVFCGKDNIKKKYVSLVDFYEDNFCDNFVVELFSIHDHYIKDIFVDIIPEV